MFTLYVIISTIVYAILAGIAFFFIMFEFWKIEEPNFKEIKLDVFYGEKILKVLTPYKMEFQTWTHFNYMKNKLEAYGVKFRHYQKVVEEGRYRVLYPIIELKDYYVGNIQREKLGKKAERWGIILYNNDYKVVRIAKCLPDFIDEPSDTLMKEGGYHWGGIVFIHNGIAVSYCLLAFIIHEWVEMHLERKGIPHRLAHYVANLFEKLFTGAPCGLYW